MQMTELKQPAKTAQMAPEQARAQARKQADAAKHIVGRIKAAKAKRAASRPKPRVGEM